MALQQVKVRLGRPKVKKNKWLSVLMIAGLLFTTACSSNATEAVEQAKAETKKVGTMVVKKEKVVRSTELAGTLQPLDEAIVSFEVGGRITELKRQEGDNVAKGEVLARVDDSDYSLQLARANAGVTQADASLDQVNNGARQQEIATAQAIVDKAKVGYQQALDNFKRSEKLYQEKAISQNDFENAQNRLIIADKDLQTAQQSYSLVVQGARPEVRDQTRAALDLAIVAKHQAALTLAKTQLKSPISGTIISKLTSAGELVSPGTPVYRIGKIDTLKVVLPVPDSEISNWREGDAVTLALYNQKREAKVSKIYPATNESTGTIGVEVIVANGKHDWFAGQVVKATKQFQGKLGIFVPVSAVISTGEPTPYVFVMKAGKAVKTPVTTGELIQNKLEILTGVKQGDQVIIKGVDRLFDGDPVELAGGSEQ